MATLTARAFMAADLFFDTRSKPLIAAVASIHDRFNHPSLYLRLVSGNGCENSFNPTMDTAQNEPRGGTCFLSPVTMIQLMGAAANIHSPRWFSAFYSQRTRGLQLAHVVQPRDRAFRFAPTRRVNRLTGARCIVLATPLDGTRFLTHRPILVCDRLTLKG